LLIRCEINAKEAKSDEKPNRQAIKRRAKGIVKINSK
jgi:hypothetical protein